MTFFGAFTATVPVSQADVPVLEARRIFVFGCSRNTENPSLYVRLRLLSNMLQQSEHAGAGWLFSEVKN